MINGNYFYCLILYGEIFYNMTEVKMECTCYFFIRWKLGMLLQRNKYKS